VPAARVAGKLIDAQNKPLAGYWVSLEGPDRPAASSVMGTISIRSVIWSDSVNARHAGSR
jgi:hypothetical protein